MSGKVLAIVLQWDGLEDTLRCLDALRSSGHPDLSVLVVDNGSRDPGDQILLERFPEAALLRLPTNLGYAAGNNAGMAWALGGGGRDPGILAQAGGAGLGTLRPAARGSLPSLPPDFLWVLNNDAMPDSGCLDRMLEAAAESPTAGAFGPKIVEASRPGRIWATWGEITWLQSLVALPGQGRDDDGTFDCTRVVPWITGCSILFRAEALREVGGFDADFFAYHEDADWGARAAARGWNSVYVGSASVRHSVHGSSGGAEHYGGFRKYLSARNSVLYARRHGSVFEQLRLAAAVVGTLPFVFLRRAATGQAAGVLDKIRGWRDGLLGRPVPLERLGLR